MKDSALYADSEIINKVLAGEVALFEILIRRNNPFLYKIGRSYNYNHEDTQDLMQDTFINAYTHLAKFENRSSFRTWILKIMLNNCYKKQQKFSFSHEKPNEISDKSIPMFTSQYSHPTETVQNRELSSVIENSLRQLPVDYRVVFVLREINGFSVKETASILDITETNVKVRLNRARTMLRKGIEQSYKPGDIFEFNLIYCDMIVSNVMQKLQAIPTKPQRSQNEYD